MSFSESSINASEILAASSPQLEQLFDPYNHVLTKLIHPAFHWHHRDHYKRPLNATERVAHAKKTAEAEARKATNKKRTERRQKEMAEKSAAWRKTQAPTAVAGTRPRPRPTAMKKIPKILPLWARDSQGGRTSNASTYEHAACMQRVLQRPTLTHCLDADDDLARCVLARTAGWVCGIRKPDQKCRRDRTFEEFCGSSARFPPILGAPLQRHQNRLLEPISF